MSEEETLYILLAGKNSIITAEGTRYVFSIGAAGQLDCTMEQLITGIPNKTEFAKFENMLRNSGDYRLRPETDKKGAYIKVTKRGESQQLKIVPLEDTTEAEETAEAIELANNVFEGCSNRPTNNKDTRKIDLTALLEKARRKEEDQNRYQ